MSSHGSRIAKNTVFLYIRMLVVMLINLYSVRLLISALGIEDYGIFNVVASVVTVMSSISSVLQTATQRFYSFALGRKDLNYFQSIFSSSLLIHIFLTIFVILLGETIGLWVVNYHLEIPSDKLHSINWVYQLSIFTFIFTFLHTPFSAATIAHEDLKYFSILSFLEAFLKFCACVYLRYFQENAIIVYGIFLLVISFLLLISYYIIGKFKYQECNYNLEFDIPVIKELLNFSSWSLFSSTASVGISQISTILTNIFFGPLITGARVISFQFNLALNSFISSFLIAFNPVMIKSYADNSHSYLLNFFSITNKIIFYVLLIIVIPVYHEMDTVLYFWLGIIDHDTIEFSRYMLIYSVIMALNNPIGIIIQASGQLKEYSLKVESLTLLVLPLTYVLFKLGFPAKYSFFVMIFCALFAHIVRLKVLRKYFTVYSHKTYLKSFVIPAIIVMIISNFAVQQVHNNVDNIIERFIAVLIIAILFVIFLSLFIGFTLDERSLILKKVRDLFKFHVNS